MSARKIKSTSDQLRSIKRARRDELGDLLEELREVRDEFETGNEEVDGLDDKKVDVETLITMIRRFDSDLADELENASCDWNGFVEGLEIPEACASFVEEFDACVEALETFDQLVDAENYPGIGDERREAWDEVVAAADVLADACDSLSIDLTEETVTS